MMRASGLRGDPERFARGQAFLGEPMWRPPSPKGFADDEGAWIDTMGQRLDIANNFAERVAERVDPNAVLETALGPLASAATRASRRPRREPPTGAHAGVHVARISTEVIMALLHLPTRRAMLVGSGALFAWAYAPKLARAEGRDPRLLVIVLRGALDGLAMVAPIGDPDWVGLRGDRALVLDGKTPALPLELVLCPQSGDAEPSPALPGAAGDHRSCDGDSLSRALAFRRPGRARKRAQPSLAPTDSGWLNRALSSLAADGRVNPQGSRAFAVGPVTPLVVRGPAPVMSWVPQQLLPGERRHPDAPARSLPSHRSASLRARSRGVATWSNLARDGAMSPTSPAGGPGPATMARVREYVANTAGAAAKYLAQPDGPRVGAAGFVGWDTHINEGAAGGQLATLLGALDEAIAAIEKAMGNAWSETVVAIVTEFGRTARINGTDGTDHGTATVAVLVGGALRGGRVIADWPGLKPADLHEGRDLKPTIDLRAVLKGVLKDHLRVDERALAATIFPGSDDVKSMTGLCA